MQQGVEYLLEGSKCVVRYQAPGRNFLDFRTEVNNDALKIKNTYDQVYVLFSSGVDSQVIARSFVDMGVDAEYIFLNPVGRCDVELAHIHECEKFFGFKVRIIDINLQDYKSEWVARSKIEYPFSMFHYPFEWLSQQLEGNFPIITQGANDPQFMGTDSKNVSIYCNYFETMQQRFRMMGKYRKIIDFPFSPEAIASYYTDDVVKAFCSAFQYYSENKLSVLDGSIVNPSHYWNYYGKGIMKAKHFKDDIIWYGKLSGYETYPGWFVDACHINETKVSVPYWDLVNFLENNRSTYKDYSEWIYDCHSKDSKFATVDSAAVIVTDPEIEKYLDYDYFLFNNSNLYLIEEYEKMFEKYKNDTGDYLSRARSSQVDGGVLLKKENEIIAGIFFHSKSYVADIVIHLAYVNDEHRGHRIHQQLHKCLDIIAKSLNRKQVYSTILQTNKQMIDHAGPRVGYKIAKDYSLLYRAVE